MKKAKTKAFDCVEMKRQGARAVQEMIKAMTPEEEIAFWHSRSQQLKQQAASNVDP
jgi:hypothetical protein